MPSNVFVSYDHDNQNQVNGFRLLTNNPNYPLDFHDHSLKMPVTDRNGRVIKVPPSDSRSKPVRDEIIAKFKKSSRLVVLIGEDTHKSVWVKWEIEKFIELKKPFAGNFTWKRIRGMKLKGSSAARMPNGLKNGNSTQELNWNPKDLNDWLEEVL